MQQLEFDFSRPTPKEDAEVIRLAEALLEALGPTEICKRKESYALHHAFMRRRLAKAGK